MKTAVCRSQKDVVPNFHTQIGASVFRVVKLPIQQLRSQLSCSRRRWRRSGWDSSWCQMNTCGVDSHLVEINKMMISLRQTLELKCFFFFKEYIYFPPHLPLFCSLASSCLPLSSRRGVVYSSGLPFAFHPGREGRLLLPWRLKPSFHVLPRLLLPGPGGWGPLCSSLFSPDSLDFVGFLCREHHSPRVFFSAPPCIPSAHPDVHAVDLSPSLSDSLRI